MLRLMGDNGKPNDDILMHILSPYPKDRSALADCVKLLESRLQGRKAVVIYGFDYPSLADGPRDRGVRNAYAPEHEARGPSVAGFDHLVHPVHTSGRVFG
jgi:hypothetical protein